jgi:hypothetical protein
VDLLSSLQAKLKVLPEGEHSPGLRAVLTHVDAAFKHLSRGQELADDSLFTDAVYRTNQAFEGSIKEAYRVLAGSDPAKKRPLDIENYLEKNKIFKSRVLAQFRNYRTEWRNPSTHDYTLLFDESEAFLAIISVAGFAYLLLDEIAERLSQQASRAETEAAKGEFEEIVASGNEGLFETVKTALVGFARLEHSIPLKTESQVIGALSGFLSTLLPDLRIEIEKLLSTSGKERADLVLGDGQSNIIVELKRGRPTDATIIAGLSQLSRYMGLAKAIHGVLFFVPEQPGAVVATEIPIARVGGYAILLTSMSYLLAPDASQRLAP